MPLSKPLVITPATAPSHTRIQQKHMLQAAIDIATILMLLVIFFIIPLCIQLYRQRSKNKFKNDIESQSNTRNHQTANPSTGRPRAATASSSIMRGEHSSFEYGTCSPKKNVRFAEPDADVKRNRSRSEVDRERFLDEQRAAEEMERVLFAKLKEGSLHIPSDSEEEREGVRGLAKGTYLDEDAEIEGTHIGLRRARDDEWSEELRYVL